MSIPRLALAALTLGVLATAPASRAAADPPPKAVEGGGVLSINDVAVTEGNAGTTNAVFTVTLSAVAGVTVTVDFTTADGTATAPADYTTTAGTLSFAPGTTTQTVTVPVAGDVLDEANEGYFVNLSNPVNATIGDPQGAGTINDNDPLPTLSINNATVLEGNAGSVNATFTVSLNVPSGQLVSVNYITSDDSAFAGLDYTFATGTLTFAPGTTVQTFDVTVLGDTLDETDEDYFVDLFNIVNAGATDSQGLGIITDDDNPPNLSISDVTVTEGNAGPVAATFDVTLSAPSDKTIQVNFATANGTAVSPGDYTAASGSVSFSPGATARTITVNVQGDTLDEANETFNVNLSAPINVTIVDGLGVGTITDDDGPPSVSINDVTQVEGVAAFTFTATLSVPSGQVVTVDFATADGSATAPADYTSNTGTLSFAAGTTTRTATVTVINDTLDENNETFFVNLSNPVNVILADPQGLGTITDNDNPPRVSIGSTSVVEGNSGTTNAVFTLSLTGASGLPITVDFATANGTATAPGDYTATTGTASFAPGSTTQTVSVPVVGDTLDENNETFTATLSNPVNATIALGGGTGTGTITDDDTATISIDDVTVAEGNAGTTSGLFTVSLSTPSSFAVTVDFATADGSAVAPGDYLANTGTVSFAPGVTSQPVGITVVGDLLDENDESFFVNLTNGVNAGITDNQGLGTITDDDTAAISIDDVTVTEGDAGTVSAVFTVSLSNPSSFPVTVDFATADNTATAGPDYVAGTGTVSFAPLQVSQTLTVLVAGDVLDEADETYFVNLTNPTNAVIADNQGVGSIGDDDAPPLISIDDVTVTEGNAGTVGASFTLSLSAPSGLPISVNFATADNTATAGLDYVAATGSVSFARGQTSQTVTVQVNGDLVDESDESFFVNLSGATNAGIADSQGLGTITDDDTATLSINDVTVTEGNAGTTNAVFAISLSNPSSSTVTVDFATADNTAIAGTDYVASTGTVTFNPGQTSQAATVQVNGDLLDENDESFFVNLTNGVNAGIADNQGVGAITDDDTATISINDVSVTEGNAGTTGAVFAVSLSNPSSFPVTVDFATADNTATAGADYVAAAGTVSFSPGQTAQTTTVQVSGDLLDEADETFFVDLSNASNAAISDNQGLGTITDDDNRPTMSINDVTVTEGSSGTTNAVFTVTLSGPSSLPISVGFATADGSATSPADYASASGTLSFPRGTTAQTVTVAVVGDALDENDETFFVNLSGATNATIADSQGLGTITDDDTAPALAINDVTVTEGSSGTTNAVFTVSLSAPSGLPISVNFATADGSATNPADYASASGTLSFARGTTTQTVTVAVVGDALDENDETLFVDLSGATNATIADNQGLGTITDDDTAPTLAINDVTVTEGSSGTTNAVFTVSLSAASGLPISVSFATADGSATSPADYASASGTLSFARGTTTQTVTVAVVGDTLDENDETLFVDLSGATNATIADSQGIGTITDDDAPPAISITDVTVIEGDSGTTNATFTVSLGAASNLPITVDFATADGTATAPGDYAAASGTLSFARGATTQTVTVVVASDTLDEADETFLVNLSNPSNATLADPQGVGTITDDDAAPAISISDDSVLEGSTGTTNAQFAVTLSAPSGLPITVDFATADGTATAPADYTAGAGTLSFAPGTTLQVVPVPIVRDALDEADETFFVDLTNASNASIADNQGLGTIIDDDAPPAISISDVTVTEGNSGTVSAVFTVSLDAASGLPITVDFATADGSANAPGDYTAASGTLSFPRGATAQTVTVDVVGDTLAEASETFLVDLTNPTNASVADAQGVGTITDDDTLPDISITDVTVAEGDSGTTSAVFTVSLSAPSGLLVSVDFATSDGTANAPGDYTAASGTLSFAPGTTTQSVAVDVLGDTLDEVDETFNVDLSNATNGTIADAQGVGTITDDDSTAKVELVHGTTVSADLAGVDLYRIRQRPGSSYEVVVDGAGGDVVPLQLERLDSAGSVLQSAVPVSGGSSLSLRFVTASPTVVDDEQVRVASVNCTTGCGPEDVYRLRAYETTASISRFNNSSSQTTGLVLQNAGQSAISGTISFWDAAGAPAGQQAFSLAPKQSFVLNTSSVAPGTSGSITIAHDGEYGQLAGKAISVETATGFTFDTELRYRPR